MKNSVAHPPSPGPLLPLPEEEVAVPPAPEGETGEVELSDLLDISAIQTLLDDFNRLTRIPMALLDIKGKVLAGAGWQEICTKFHRVHPETGRNCLESDTRLTAGVPLGEFRMYKCKNNMWDVSTPLYLEGEHVGNLFAGQFFFEGEPIDYALFREQARRYGFDEERYLAALEAVPRLTRNTVETGMTIFSNFAHLLSLIGYNNVRLARAEKSLHRALAEAETERGKNEAIIAAIDDIVTVQDAEFRILYQNPASEAAMGKHVGERCYQAFHRLAAPCDGCLMAKTFRDGKVHRGEKVLLAPGNLQQYFDFTVSPIKDAGGRTVAAVEIVRDITERKRTELRLSIEHAVSEIVATAPSVAEAIPCVLEAICSSIDWAVGGVWWEDPRGKGLRLIHDWYRAGFDAEEFVKSGRAIILAPDEGLPGRVWTSQEAIWIEDVLVEENFPRKRFAAACGVRGAFAFPLVLGGRSVGVMEFYSREPRKTDLSLLHHLAPLGSQIGQLIERKESEAAVVRISNLYAALSKTNKAIMYSRNLDALFQEVCQVAVDYGRFCLAGISMIEEETNLVRPVAFAGSDDRHLDSVIVSVDFIREEGQGPSGVALREDRAYVCNDFMSDPAAAPWRKTALANGIRASAVFPLRGNDRTVGLLKVYAAQRDYFDQKILDLLTEMAKSISFAIDNFSREELRREAQEALRKSEERLKRVLEGSNDGFWDCDLATKRMAFSPRFAEMLGYDPDEIEPTIAARRTLVHPDDWPRVKQAFEQHFAGKSAAYEVEFRSRTKGGGWEWVLDRGRIVERDTDDSPLRMAGTTSIITERKRYEEKLNYISTHDTMTGLFNRAFYDAELVRLTGSRRYPVSIVIADVDGLKGINDSLGHAAGDRLIQLAAKALREAVRPEDVVARVGGDEFAILLPGTDVDAVREVTGRVRRSQEAINGECSDFTLEISIGAATAETSDHLREALHLADTRMYDDKFRKKSRKEERTPAWTL